MLKICCNYLLLSLLVFSKFILLLTPWHCPCLLVWKWENDHWANSWYAGWICLKSKSRFVVGDLNLTSVTLNVVLHLGTFCYSVITPFWAALFSVVGKKYHISWFQWSMSLESHCWGSYHGTLSSLCNSFEDRAPIDEVYRWPILKWVAVTWLKDSALRKKSHDGCQGEI